MSDGEPIWFRPGVITDLRLGHPAIEYPATFDPATSRIRERSEPACRVLPDSEKSAGLFER